MKKIITILLLLAFVSCKKEDFKAEFTREFAIQSTSTGANYTIKVALPQNYNSELQKYATIYVLDGEENFDLVAMNCQIICSERSSTNVLVVSIGYGNDRAVDYTPTDVAEGGGGAEKFMHFIKDELMPKMEMDFGADSSRKSKTILGHSFGGLLGAYAFAKFNDVFGNYLMLSPSLWYDNEIVLKYEKENRSENKKSHQLVFLGLGEMENSGRMLAPFEAYYQQLQNNYPDLIIKKSLEPHLSHGGSKNPNIIKALNFYFQNR